jgi:conjugal transfer pilus assembly protein TraW
MRCLGVCFVCVLCTQVHAVSLGVVGEVFPVQERSFLVFIETRLRALQASGALDDAHAHWVQDAENNTRRPIPLGLTRAKQTVVHRYVPRVMLEDDVKDSDGHILFHTQRYMNALEALPLYAPHWIFFDADDRAQRSWARHVIEQTSHVKLILTGGDVRVIEDEFKADVFFDQAGRITKKLRIEHVPAEVVRDGDALLIRDVLIHENGQEDRHAD